MYFGQNIVHFGTNLNVVNIKSWQKVLSKNVGGQIASTSGACNKEYAIQGNKQLPMRTKENYSKNMLK